MFLKVCFVKKQTFEKPIGYFDHEAIRKYDRTEYDILYHELMKEYDKVIHVLLEGGEYSLSDERRMSELLRLLLELSLLPIYQVINKDFYNKFLVEGKVDYGSKDFRCGFFKKAGGESRAAENRRGGG